MTCRERIGSISKDRDDKEREIDFTVRKLTLQFIKEESCFTDEDIKDYRNKCIDIFVNQIIVIGRSEIPFIRKKELYNRIRKDDYYEGFLTKVERDSLEAMGPKGFLFLLFKYKYDLCIVLAIILRKHYTSIVK